MDISEKDIEDVIFETDDSVLCSHGLAICEGKILKKMRQVYLGPAGYADLVLVSRFKYKSCSVLRINVVELKKDKVDTDTILQALRYVFAIQCYLKVRKFNGDYEFAVTILGRRFSNGEIFSYLPHLVATKGLSTCGSVNYVGIYTYSIGIDGIQFHEEDVDNMVNQSDVALYMFEQWKKKSNIPSLSFESSHLS